MENKKTIRGTEYTFKKLPARQWVRLRDRCKNRYGVIMEETYMSEIFEHLVVDPKVSLDDLEWDEAQEVANEAVKYQLGDAAQE